MRDLLSKALLLIFCGVSIQAVAMDDSNKENSINKISITLPERTKKKWHIHTSGSKGAERFNIIEVKLRANSERILMLRNKTTNILNKDTQKILNVAASKDDFQSAYALLASGAKVNGLPNESSPLHAATSPRMVKFLIKNKANPHNLDEFNLTPLQVALYQDEQDNALIGALLKHDANPNAIDFYGFTPLQVALNQTVRNWTVIETLLRYGANPDVEHQDGRTLLDIACSNRKWHIIKFILASEIDLNVLNERGYASLHYACLANDPRSIHLLLAKGANPFIEDKHGELPIHKINANNIDLIEMLEKKMFVISKQ